MPVIASKPKVSPPLYPAYTQGGAVNTPVELPPILPTQQVLEPQPITQPPQLPVLHGGDSQPYTAPQWGCLKGGSLPTYRQYTQRQTMKRPTPQLEILSDNPFTGIGGQREELMKQMSEKFQMGTVTQKEGGDNKTRLPRREPKYKKQRKIVRRTYRLGKSKVFPRISVLVSNKTVRKDINDKIHAIQETPMHEVRNFLVKNGFIKVGSSAPNDILRKMYENLKIINSEVKNHNTETLLYNYLQNPER